MDIHHPRQKPADWDHSNAIVYDEASDAYYVSVRHQDAIIKVNRSDETLEWILGTPANWESPFAEKRLTPVGEVTWPYHQHSPQWQDDGTLLLYDNGLGNPGLPGPMETSRAVRYAVDSGTMTVAQVWEDEAEDFMAPIAGDADRLPDGSILVTDSSIDMGIGMIHATVREIDEETSATPQWSFTTEIGTFIYRCVATLRLPGESR